MHRDQDIDISDSEFTRLVRSALAHLYDHAYLRKTWQQDKSERTPQVLKYREVWETAPIVGLGTRIGPFWYPASIPEPPLPDDEA